MTDTVGLWKARELGEKHKLRGLIIISITPEGGFAVVTWGKNQAECKQFAKVGDNIAERIEAEDIEIPGAVS